MNDEAPKGNEKFLWHEGDLQIWKPAPVTFEDGQAKKLIDVHGLIISVENPKGSTRSGFDANGFVWTSRLTWDYGYISGYEGADGDSIDAFVGPNHQSDKVFVVNQIDPDTGDFDETKVMLGFDSEDEARRGYLSNYEVGWAGLESVKEMTVEAFKAWLESGAHDEKAYAWDESKHPRKGKGSPEGGEFAAVTDYGSHAESVKWRKSLNKEQVAAFRHYTGTNDYIIVNNLLQGKKNWLIKNRKAFEDNLGMLGTVGTWGKNAAGTFEESLKMAPGISAKLTAALDKAKYPEAGSVYRGAYIKENIKEGQVLVHKGFMSATTDRAMAMRFAGRSKGGDYGGVLMKIHIPKGAKAASLGTDKTLTTWKGQHEVVIQRGSRIKITKITGIGEKRSGFGSNYIEGVLLP